MLGARFGNWAEILRLPFLVLRTPAKLAQVLKLDPAREMDLAVQLSELAMTLLGQTRFAASHYRPVPPSGAPPGDEELLGLYRSLLTEERDLDDLEPRAREHVRYVAQELKTGRFVDARLFESADESLAVLHALRRLRE